MNYMNATGSLNFSHYYGERDCRLLGLETAQGLPSDTLMFAFLRGAGKQYGRLTYQATSIWNRFGYNMYHDRKTESRGRIRLRLRAQQGLLAEPAQAAVLLQLPRRPQHRRHRDLAVHRRRAVRTASRSSARWAGSTWSLRQWVDKHPDRGVMYTPVAFMLDFYNGWNMPRHLYRGDKYKIWGKFPYEKGDYLIDGVFRMVWPGYEDCSYLRNERGFLTATPFGDIFDVITNRCHPEILKQYAAVMLLGDVEMTPEVIGRLADYVRAGGDLVIDARAAKALPAELTGVRLEAQAKGCTSHLLADGQTFEEQPYGYTILSRDSAGSLLVNEHGHPLVTVNRAGEGRVVVGAVDHWMTDALTYRMPRSSTWSRPINYLAAYEREHHQPGERPGAQGPDEQEHRFEVEQDEDDRDRIVLDRHRLHVHEVDRHRAALERLLLDGRHRRLRPEHRIQRKHQAEEPDDRHQIQQECDVGAHRVREGDRRSADRGRGVTPGHRDAPESRQQSRTRARCMPSS